MHPHHTSSKDVGSSTRVDVISGNGKRRLPGTTGRDRKLRVVLPQPQEIYLIESWSAQDERWIVVFPRHWHYIRYYDPLD